MPAYDEFDSNKPDGSVGTGATFAADLLKNLRSGARDHGLIGRIKGFLFSRTQGTGPDVARPQFIYMMNDTLSIGFRMEFTWGGGAVTRPTNVEWRWASGADYNANPALATWTLIGAQANTFDSGDNITATTNSSGFFTLLLEVWAKVLGLGSNFNAHVAGTGTAVHGLGSMSTQAANNVAITGGTVNNADVGTTTRAKGNFTRVVEDRLVANPALNAGVTLDVNVYGGAFITNNGNNTITLQNGQGNSLHGVLVYVSNLDQSTFAAASSISWGLGGKPACNGGAEVALSTYNGSDWLAKVTWRSV